MTQRSYVPVTVETPCLASPDTALRIIAPIDLTAIFKGWGPLPAVVSVSNQTGAWDTPGASRTPHFSDGGSASERLTQYTAPHSFAYELTGFTNALRLMVTKVRGEWTFTPDGDGSIVRWTYSFYPRKGRALLVRLVLAPIWRRYAHSALRLAVDAATGAS